jgi:hypothetical protein
MTSLTLQPNRSEPLEFARPEQIAVQRFRREVVIAFNDYGVVAF